MALNADDIGKAERIKSETDMLSAFLVEVVRQRVFGEMIDPLIKGIDIASILEDYDRAHPTEMKLDAAAEIPPVERAYFADLRHAAIRIQIIGEQLVKMAQSDEVEQMVAEARSAFATQYRAEKAEAELGEATDAFQAIERDIILGEKRLNMDNVSALVYFFELSTMLMAHIGEFISTASVPQPYKDNVKQAVHDTLVSLSDIGLDFGTQTTTALNEMFGLVPPKQQLS